MNKEIKIIFVVMLVIFVYSIVLVWLYFSNYFSDKVPEKEVAKENV